MSNAAAGIAADICDRSGGDGWWDGIDDDTQQEILQSWQEIIRQSQSKRITLAEGLLRRMPPIIRAYESIRGDCGLGDLLAEVKAWLEGGG